ncbi:MAG: dehydrogenase [Bacillota bacterium]
MRIAIIGASVCGLACALECERLGVIPDIFERDHTVGWVWPSVSFCPFIFYRDAGDIRKYLLDNYNLDIKPIGNCTSITMKSSNQEVKVEGKLGYFFSRGKGVESLEQQLLRDIRKTPIHYNRAADYKELSKKYDFVVVATGSDAVARELNVWEDLGLVRMYGGLTLGSFDPNSTSIYFNTDYAGTGYARVTPFNASQAVVKLYVIGRDEFQEDMLFSRFLEQENLKHLEFIYKINPNPFTTGRVKKFRVGNILLAGRAAGLTERLLGVGCPEALISGVSAARAMIQNLDYEAKMKDLRLDVENIAAFRDIVNSFDNKDFDMLLSIIKTPGIKQLLYNSPMNLVDLSGSILRKVKEFEATLKH